MIRLSAPEQGYEATIREIINGITGNNKLKDRVLVATPELFQAGNNYLSAGSSGDLYAIAPIDTAADCDPVVIGKLHKSELIKLYEYYFRNNEKAARKIYDKILNAAHEKCPFCGGIGTPRNLDHFLPKAHFPQFATLPQNLVPSCRDCNMDGKSQGFARVAEKQLIQPYIDHERFFVNQWIFAKYRTISDSMPGVLCYYVQPPAEWDQVHKDRVRQHFTDFELARRYSVKAAELLGTTEKQIAAMRQRGVSSTIICTDLLTPGIENAPFINHWQKGMFQALKASIALD